MVHFRIVSVGYTSLLPEEICEDLPAHIQACVLILIAKSSWSTEGILGFFRFVGDHLLIAMEHPPTHCRCAYSTAPRDVAKAVLTQNWIIGLCTTTQGPGGALAFYNPHSSSRYLNAGWTTQHSVVQIGSKEKR